MEDIIAKREERMVPKIIKNLAKRHFTGYWCPTSADVISKVKELMPRGSSVSWGGSMTIRDMGLTAALKDGSYEVYDRDEVGNDQEKKVEMYRKAFFCDYYLSSFNAMSEDGVIVNIDGNGNRVAAITWGPKHVIFVASLDKITQDVDSAIKRARSTAAPINAARFNINTPCQVDGFCHNCNYPQSVCNYIQLIRNSSAEGRIIVLLTSGKWGY